MAAKDFSADYLRSILAYDPDTGVFTRLVRTANRHKIGNVAGHRNGNGYIRFVVLSKRYYAHRLAWLYVTGDWPVGEIDHIDGNRSNNAISNLRDVSASVNLQNQRFARSDNIHGFMGVSRSRNRWSAHISINGKKRHIGQFDTADEAHAAYLNAKRLHHVGCTI